MPTLAAKIAYVQLFLMQIEGNEYLRLHNPHWESTVRTLQFLADHLCIPECQMSGDPAMREILEDGRAAIEVAWTGLEVVGEEWLLVSALAGRTEAESAFLATYPHLDLTQLAIAAAAVTHVDGEPLPGEED